MELDEREGYSPGWKFNEWEMKGVPVRLELGPRDIEAGGVTAVRRDTGEKVFLAEEGLEASLGELLEEIQKNLYRQALDFLTENTRRAADYEEFKKILEAQRGFIKAGWCGELACEEQVKDETRATIRCIPFQEEQAPRETCLKCGKDAEHLVYYARAY